MNECNAIKPLLALRAADWSAKERARVEAHLERCETCAALRAVYAEQDRLIRGLPALTLTSTQRAAVWTQAEDQRREPRGAILVGFNVLSALSTTFGVIVLLVNLLLVSGAADVRRVVVPPSVSPSVTATVRVDIPALEATPAADDADREPTPEPAPQPEMAHWPDQRSEHALQSQPAYLVFHLLMSDTKELV